MSDRVNINDEFLDDVVGGNLTYTWFGGVGRCGLNGNHKWGFDNKVEFESFMQDCMINKHMTDIETLKAMLANGIIRKVV